MYFVSPWMTNGNLNSYLRRNPSSNKLDLAIGVADGLSYLHSLGPPLVHGDICGNNVLIDDNERVRLGDYGIIGIREDLNGESPGSTAWLRWAAPERLDPLYFGLRQSEAEAPAADIFSFGMLIYEMLAEDKPFADVKRDMAVASSVRSGARPLVQSDWETSTSTRPLVEVMRQCWDGDRSARPSAGDIAVSLRAACNAVLMHLPIHCTR